MDRRRVWPDFREACIVHEDRSLIVVDKPAGVPSQAADPDRPDDVVTRLRSFLRARGKGDYLGVHQRLDRDTSGVLVMTRRREANPAVAAQFEGRKVTKTYLACVRGWKAAGARVTLRDHLAPGDGGLVRVVPRTARGAQLAVTHVKVLGRRADRALLELDLETGRTHQARVQLAHAGAPIAGDTLYGGAPAPRLLLHARAIGMVHPDTQRRVAFEAPAPAEMDDWLARGDPGFRIYDDAAALDRAIARAVERRWGLGRADEGPRATTAFRLIHEAGDALPGLAVDVYGDHLVAQLYDDPEHAWSAAARDRVLDRLHAVGARGVYLKIRPRQANTLVDTRREDLAPRLPVRGEAAPDEIDVLEEGVAFAVRLGDGLSTGIFLDQRANRVRVRAIAGGARVLNLFAYACAFSVVAAAGGARGTVSVDASPAALERGRAQMERMGLLAAGDHRFVAEDAFSFLSRAARRGDAFDLVCLDPPSYSTTRSRRFVASRDYAELAAAAIAVVAPGGRLLACTNHRGIHRAKFRRALGDAARAAGRAVRQLKDLPDPVDFPAPPGGESHLKSALVTLA